MEDKDKILKAFEESGKALKTAEIAEHTGIDKKEVSKLVKKLKTEEKIFSPKRCYYDIKK